MAFWIRPLEEVEIGVEFRIQGVVDWCVVQWCGVGWVGVVVGSVPLDGVVVVGDRVCRGSHIQ